MSKNFFFGCSKFSCFLHTYKDVSIKKSPKLIQGSWPSLTIKTGLIILKKMTINKLKIYNGKFIKYFKNDIIFINKILRPPFFISDICFFRKIIIMNLSFSKRTVFYLELSNCFHIFFLSKLLGPMEIKKIYRKVLLRLIFVNFYN